MVANYATIDLLYKPTSWEYVQFLDLANDNSIAFLANEGANMLQAWLSTGMAEPHVMASTSSGTMPEPPPPPCDTPGVPPSLIAKAGRLSVSLRWGAGNPPPDGGYRAQYNQSGKYQFIADVPATTLQYRDGGLQRGVQYCYLVTAWNDCNGNGAFDEGVDTESTASNEACATAR